mmetsp:Transcript_72824/g.171275  ORF Transcript_72824/g.171275 Transcript_72824/m.171275 type:complete len:204 (+) Transcript_72824:162-773(+)
MINEILKHACVSDDLGYCVLHISKAFDLVHEHIVDHGKLQPQRIVVVFHSEERFLCHYTSHESHCARRCCQGECGCRPTGKKGDSSGGAKDRCPNERCGRHVQTKFQFGLAMIIKHRFSMLVFFCECDELPPPFHKFSLLCRFEPVPFHLILNDIVCLHIVSKRRFSLVKIGYESFENQEGRLLVFGHGGQPYDETPHHILNP